MARKTLSIPIANLLLDPDNVRKHGEVDVDAIANSLKQFGQQSPIVVQKLDKGKFKVIKGNGTTMAAMKLGWTSMECWETSLSDAQLRAYAIADNQTALLSEWDDEKLAEQLRGFDPDLQSKLGFDDEHLKRLLEPWAADINVEEVHGDEVEDVHKMVRVKVKPELVDKVKLLVTAALEAGEVEFEFA